MSDRDPLETTASVAPLAWFGCGFFILCLAAAYALVTWAEHTFK